MALTLTAVFSDLPDPRTETANKRHLLSDILTLATCAVLAGADSWEQIAQYGRSKEAFFRRFLELRSGVPSHDTFYRVFTRLDPDAFADRFGRWLATACAKAGLAHVAVDGKSARRAKKATFAGCLHLAEAWAVENRLVLGQRSVNEGSHEIAAIPELLASLDLVGSVVTIDAAGCQKEVVKQARRQGGDYLVCVKGNQKSLRDAVCRAFGRACDAGLAGCDSHAEEGSGHGRSEERYVTVIHDPEGLPEGWEGVGSVALACRERRVKGQANQSGGHYYLSSLKVSAAELAGYIRRHWGIENGLHWVLDVAFREDESRTRGGHAGANLAMVRRVAVSLLARAGPRGSTQLRRMRAAWDDDYLLGVLQGISIG